MRIHFNWQIIRKPIKDAKSGGGGRDKNGKWRGVVGTKIESGIQFENWVPKERATPFCQVYFMRRSIGILFLNGYKLYVFVVIFQQQ